MSLFKWLLGGVSGGAIGAVIWIVVSHYLNAEVGYIAWGIGILTGMGVRMASRYDGTPPTTAQSVVAAMIAVSMVLGAKFLVTSITLEQWVAEQGLSEPGEMVNEVSPEEVAELEEMAALRKQFPESLAAVTFTAEELPLRLARNEAERRETAGETLAWPEGMNLQAADTEDDMPPDVMQWAREKVQAMSPEELQAAIEKEEAVVNGLIDALKQLAAEPGTEAGKVTSGEDTSVPDAPEQDQRPFVVGWEDRFDFFMDSLGMFDLLWVGLAMASAYRISADDESNVPPSNDSPDR